MSIVNMGIFFRGKKVEAYSIVGESKLLKFFLTGDSQVLFNDSIILLRRLLWQ